jgi:hypothetical protein
MGRENEPFHVKPHFSENLPSKDTRFLGLLGLSIFVTSACTVLIYQPSGVVDYPGLQALAVQRKYTMFGQLKRK